MRRGRVMGILERLRRLISKMLTWAGSQVEQDANDINGQLRLVRHNNWKAVGVQGRRVGSRSSYLGIMEAFNKGDEYNVLLLHCGYMLLSMIREASYRAKMV